MVNHDQYLVPVIGFTVHHSCSVNFFPLALAFFYSDVIISLGVHTVFFVTSGDYIMEALEGREVLVFGRCRSRYTVKLPYRGWRGCWGQCRCRRPRQSFLYTRSWRVTSSGRSLGLWGKEHWLNTTTFLVGTLLPSGWEFVFLFFWEKTWIFFFKSVSTITHGSSSDVRITSCYIWC